MDGYYGKWADLNGDGEVDDYEKFVVMEELAREDNDESDGADDDMMSELEMAGLDYDELTWMDEEERREVLEEAGLDIDDYDF